MALAAEASAGVYPGDVYVDNINGTFELGVKTISTDVVRKPFHDIINTKTQNGIRITDMSIHAIQRAGERGMNPADIKTALINPLHIEAA